MEKSNSNNKQNFNSTSPQQLIDNPTKTNNNTVFDTSEGLYNGTHPYTMPSEKQVDGDNRQNIKWTDYTNNMIVTPEMFIHGDIPPLVNGQDFDNIYKHTTSSFPQEQRFNFSQHRGSLQMVHNPSGSGDHFHYTSNSNLPNTLNDNNNMIPVNNGPTYLRRYTEGAIPRLNGKKQRMNSNSSSNSNSKEEEEEMNDEESKRKHFLERNRQAALKCRQRKKQWLANLQHRVEYLSTDNEQLQTQATLLREEVLNLKTLLLAHRDCKVAQANGVTMNMIQSVSSNTLQYNNVIPPSPVTSNHHIQHQQYKHPTDL